MTSRRMTLLFAGLLLLSSGCASARYVMKDAGRGVIAMPSSSPENYEKARELMAQHFPEGYVIESEQEEVVGEQTNFAHRNEKLASVTTKDKTEWRIHYRRKNNQIADASAMTGKTENVQPAAFERQHEQ